MLKRIGLITFCVMIIIIYQGCAAELLMLEEGGVATTIGEGAALSETEMAILAQEETAIFGETLPTNMELTQLENVRVVFDGSKYPKLAVIKDGISKNFAEIIGKRELKLLDGKGSFILNENIYVTRTAEVNLYSTTSNVSRIIKKINKGRMVLKIGEEKGYYKVLVGRNKVLGYIKPDLLIAVLVAGSVKENYTVIDCIHCQGHGYSFCSYCSGKGYTFCSSCNAKGYFTCNNCTGKGYNICNSCSGKGYFYCSSCTGKGYHTCTACSGKGYFVTVFGKVVTCQTCNGNGSYTCTNCGGNGSFSCNYCHGNGSMSCTICSGNGYITCKFCNGNRTFNCNQCAGNGNVQCIYCHGNGKIKSFNK